MLKTLIKYLIERRRQGDAVFHSEELLLLSKLRPSMMCLLGIVADGASVFDVFNSYAAQKRRSRDKLDVLCRLLLLPIFESNPLTLGKELAYIYGRLERMAEADIVDSLFKNLGSESDSCYHLYTAIIEDLFGQVCEQ